MALDGTQAKKCSLSRVARPLEMSQNHDGQIQKPIMASSSLLFLRSQVMYTKMVPPCFDRAHIRLSGCLASVNDKPHYSPPVQM